jgi:hypothetical protein
MRRKKRGERLEFRDQNMVLADELSGLTAIHRGMEFVGRDFPL